MNVWIEFLRKHWITTIPYMNNDGTLDPYIQICLPPLKKRRIKKDMYTILNKEEAKEFQPDPINTNVIMSVPNEWTFIKRLPDGALALCAEQDINLSGVRVLNNGLAVITFTPHIKISVPMGIKLGFYPPYSSQFHNTVYPKITSIPKTHEQYIIFEDEDQRKPLPTNFVYQDLSFTILIDLEQMKRQHGVLNIKAGTELMVAVFQPMYHIGTSYFPNIHQWYLLKNSEIYNNFESFVDKGN